MKNKGTPLSMGILVLAILFSLSLAFNMVQYYAQPRIVYSIMQEECSSVLVECPPEKACAPCKEPMPVVSTADTNTLTYVSSFEGGTLYKTKDGKFNVLDLHGNYRGMGR